MSQDIKNSIIMKLTFHNKVLIRVKLQEFLTCEPDAVPWSALCSSRLYHRGWVGQRLLDEAEEEVRPCLIMRRMEGLWSRQ
jgi:hypothetical protein